MINDNPFYLNAFISILLFVEIIIWIEFYLLFLWIFIYLLHLYPMNFDYIFVCADSWSTVFIIVLFFNEIFMLAKMEFQFTELMKGEPLKEISRSIDLSPHFLPPQNPRATKILLVCFRIKVCTVQLIYLLSWKWECNNKYRK